MNRPNPGPPSGRQFADWQMLMRAAVYEAVGPDDIREIVGALVTKAKGGDLGAAKIVLNFAIGGPTVNVKNAVFMDGATTPRPLPLRVPPEAESKIDAMARHVIEGPRPDDPTPETIAAETARLRGEHIEKMRSRVSPRPDTHARNGA